ncbi:MAG TPA: HD domain-containing phosphohydrolase, partial [Chloroflexia bacterium]|nr:HD domain-containing phosphohydrolase [Chloroflexia bacterium]
SDLLLRALYLLATAAIISVIAAQQQRTQRTMEQMHARASEQVRRLEAIQRITQQMNTVPTSADIVRLIVAETRDLIRFRNCRVHMVEQRGGGAWLPLAGFYGDLIDENALQTGALQLRVGEGITGWVAAHGRPVLAADASRDPRAMLLPGTPATPNSLLAVPLIVKTEVKGVIVLSQLGTGAFSEDDLQLMVTLAHAAAIALDNLESRDSLARQAETDAVTGLPHHGAFQAALAAALDTAEQQEESLGVALLDIDGFRSYNERLGTAAGDDALRHVATCLDRACQAASDAVGGGGQSSACCFRVGGDEFALVLSGPQGQIDTALRITQDCIQSVCGGQDGEAMLQVSLSAGLAFFPVDALTRRELLDIADATLYLARQTGGNRLGLADAAAKETIQLRHMLEEMVHSSLAESGSPTAVQQRVADAASAGRSSRHASLAEQLTTEALRALAAAIDAKDDYTRGHSERVSATATELARELGLPGDEIRNIATAARMHDIGKIGVPDDVLHKRGPLTTTEQAVMATHPDIGADILAPISTLQATVPIVRHHHEHFDGTGYPQNLAGTAIPVGARVVAVADAIDAMITDRPYRRGMQITTCLTELGQWAGSHYDPAVVAAAVALYGPGGTGLALRGVLPMTLLTAMPEAPAPPTGPHALELMMHPEPVNAPPNFSRRDRPAPDGASPH